MPRDSRQYLEDVLEAIARIRSYISGYDQDSFAKDLKTQDAVLRNLGIIGEAVGKIPYARMAGRTQRVSLHHRGRLNSTMAGRMYPAPTPEWQTSRYPGVEAQSRFHHTITPAGLRFGVIQGHRLC